MNQYMGGRCLVWCSYIITLTFNIMKNKNMLIDLRRTENGSLSRKLGNVKDLTFLGIIICANLKALLAKSQKNGSFRKK